jgi:hypothetical protein
VGRDMVRPMGDDDVGTWWADPAWAAVGHELGPWVHAVLGDEHGVLLVLGRDERYVQLHGMADRGCHVEADSGEFGDRPLAPEQCRRMLELGWTGPEEAPERPGPANYWTERDGPFDVYALVVLLVATLVEVYGCEPDDLVVESYQCGCTAAEGRAPGT